MITCRCIEKLKDKNKIVGYKLRASDGEIAILRADVLKHCIASGKIAVTNLAFTSDGKLIDKFYIGVNSRPSELKLIKQSKKSKTARTDVTDTYDSRSYGGHEYTEVSLQYFDYLGYIKDKNGNTFNVKASENQCNAGMFIGGGWEYRVVIEHHIGDIEISGFRGIAIHGRGTNIIHLLKEGFYLEDYFNAVIADGASIRPHNIEKKLY